MLDTKRLRLSLVATVSSLALVLSACSSDSGSSDAPDAPKAGKDEGPVTITWLHRLPDKKGFKTVDELVEEFNAAHPNIKVIPERMQGSAGESYAKINSIVAAGKDVPCLTQIGNERVPDMLSSMMDVSEYTKKYEDNFIPGLYDKARVGKQVFGLPFGASPILMYYRADIFDEYGIEAPKTWDEYREAAQTVREKSDKKQYMGGFLTDEIMWVNALATSEGANWFGYDPDNQEWSVNIDAEPSEKVANNLDALVADDLIVPLQRWGQDFGKFLGDGTLVTTIGGAWEAPLIADTVPEAAGKWRVTQIPHFDASTKTVGQNGGTIGAVLKGCQYPEQTVEFANWWATNIEALTGLGLLPAAKVKEIPTPDHLKTFFGGQEIYKEFVEANDNAPKVNWAPKIASTFKTMQDQQGFVGKGGTIVEELKVGQETATKSLTEAGLKVKK